MFEVSITAKFRTGSNSVDSSEAERRCKELLLNLLARRGIANEEEATGCVFNVQIVNAEAKPIE